MYYFFVIFPLTTHDLISFLPTVSFRTYLESFYYQQLNFITAMVGTCKTPSSRAVITSNSTGSEAVGDEFEEDTTGITDQFAISFLPH